MKKFLMVCSLLLSFNAFASDHGSVHIAYLHTNIKHQQLEVDSQVFFNLSDRVKKALEHEIPLHFNVEFRLVVKNSFLGFDYEEVVLSKTHQITLLYLGYDNKYHISNQRSQINQSFSHLNSALRTFGTIEGFNIVNLAKLPKNKEYSIELRVKLNPWKLPTPLIIESFTNSSWFLSSNWYKTRVLI